MDLVLVDMNKEGEEGNLACKEEKKRTAGKISRRERSFNRFSDML